MNRRKTTTPQLLLTLERSFVTPKSSGPAISEREFAGAGLQVVLDLGDNFRRQFHVHIGHTSTEMAVAHNGAADASSRPRRDCLARGIDTLVNGWGVVVCVSASDIVPHLMRVHNEVPIVGVGFQGSLPVPTNRAHPSVVPSVVAGSAHVGLSLIHISEPTRLLSISYAVFCLKKKKKKQHIPK
eukprot:TRINITY_DN814_c0_g1_i7.p1 TRINITY_DN814_c0_g1~~TRINITY_DN814_c0_g1_i7.p1  ORF type:complete len:184 (-),score=13.43 TRINITY_DN814_c0_g1_i7:23-574(-)